MYSSPLKTRIRAEALGTFLLVFVGCGAIAAQGRFAGPGGGITAVALAFGSALALGIALFGAASGAHFNPAVTLALQRSGRHPKAELLPYVLAQCLGAFAAALALRVLFDTPSVGETSFSVEWWQAFLIEALATFLLASVVLSVTRKEHPLHAAAPFLIGLTLLASILATGLLTGASLNPARSLGPALIQLDPKHFGEWLARLWVYLLAPLAGGWAAAELVGKR